MSAGPRIAFFGAKAAAKPWKGAEQECGTQRGYDFGSLASVYTGARRLPRPKAQNSAVSPMLGTMLPDSCFRVFIT